MDLTGLSDQLLVSTTVELVGAVCNAGALGALGFAYTQPEAMMRDAKLYEIGAGTSEIRRWLIGRELFEQTR